MRNSSPQPNFHGLTRYWWDRRFRGSMILRAVFSVDSLHFGGMIGTFVALYKFIVNVLPILTLRIRQMERVSADEFDMGDEVLPPSEDFPPTEIEIESPLDSTANSDAEHGLSLDSLAARRKSALKNIELTPAPTMEESTSGSLESSRVPSPSPQPGRRARFAEDLILPPSRKTSPETERHALRHPGHLSTTTQAAVSLMREKGYVYERWHAALAGAIAGAVAIIMEKKGRRLGISQQMFVRGLQASFNHWSEWSGVKVPLGSVWVFALW